MNAHWIVKYIGLPYVEGGRDWRGVDCWGLLCLIYKQELGIDLPALPGVVQGKPLAISREIEERSKDWVEVPKPDDGDAVAMGMKEAPHHVGVWVGADGGKVVHAWHGFSVGADTIKVLRIKGIRTIRFFRYGRHS
jgi:cell wall-associated NlpC family hydrolase